MTFLMMGISNLTMMYTIMTYLIRIIRNIHAKKHKGQFGFNGIKIFTNIKQVIKI